MIELTNLRTENGGIFQEVLGSPQYTLQTCTGPIHYKEAYRDTDLWLPIDEAYSEPGVALNGEPCLVYPKLPNITRVYTNRLGYEIQSRSNPDHIFQVQLDRVNGIDVTRFASDDRDISVWVKVHPQRVGVWKQFKRKRLIPWILRWKMTELGTSDWDTHPFVFRDNPEAFNVPDISLLNTPDLEAAKVAISTARERIDDASFYWYETIPKEAYLVDTDVWQVNSGANDGECNSGMGLLYPTTAWPVFSSAWWNWMLFTNVTIPKGATILTGTIVVYGIATSGSVTVNVGLEDADNPGNPSSASDLTSRTWITNYVSWSPEAFVNGWYEAPSLVNGIQEVIDRSGWSSGNAMMGLISPNYGEGWRKVAHYDGSPGAAPYIYATYSLPTRPPHIYVPNVSWLSHAYLRRREI